MFTIKHKYIMIWNFPVDPRVDRYMTLLLVFLNHVGQITALFIFITWIIHQLLCEHKSYLNLVYNWRLLLVYFAVLLLFTAYLETHSDMCFSKPRHIFSRFCLSLGGNFSNVFSFGRSFLKVSSFLSPRRMPQRITNSALSRRCV